MKKVIKMSAKRVALVSAVRAAYGEEASVVTRKELQAIVDVEPRVHSWPTWLVNNDDLRLDRGLYVLPENNGSYDDGSKEVPVAEMITPEASALATVSLATNVEVQDEQDSYVPAKHSGYVPFGNFSTVRDVLKSGTFYPMFITGLSGNGKTLMVQETCARLKREYVRANVTIETDEDDLIGGFRLLNGETVWHDGPVITAMKRGAVLLLDEIDLASNKIMCLQPILEGSSIYIKKIGKWVHPTDGFTVIATANTKGQGSDDGRFIGTNVLNEAFLERFPITLEQSYPGTKMEEKILTNEFAKSDKTEPELVTNLVRWADVIRKTFSEGGCDEIILIYSPRLMLASKLKKMKKQTKRNLMYERFCKK